MTMTISDDVPDISIFRNVFISIFEFGAACQQTTKTDNTISIYEPLMAFGFDCFLREEAI